MPVPTPQIEMSWSGGNWSRSHKRAVRPTLKCALDLAGEGLAELGISSDRPVQARIRRDIGRQCFEAGQSEGPDGFDLLVPSQILKRGKVTRFFNAFTDSAIHEATHCIRFQRTDKREDLLEHIASEGISYMTGSVFANILLTDKEINQQFEGFLDPLKPEVEQEMLEQLSNDLDNIEMLCLTDAPEEQFDAIYDRWLDYDKHLTQLPNAERLGITAVGRLITSGELLGDIISMPAEDIMGF